MAKKAEKEEKPKAEEKSHKAEKTEEKSHKAEAKAESHKTEKKEEKASHKTEKKEEKEEKPAKKASENAEEKKHEHKTEEKHEHKQKPAETHKQKPKKAKHARKEFVELKPAEINEAIVHLANEGHSASEIGMILRDQYGIPKIGKVTGKKLGAILKENKLAHPIPEDLMSLIKKNSEATWKKTKKT